MFINEACKECGLTKKAIEYYVKQGLIQPQVSDNGYRIFTDKDIALMKEVSMLRKLNINIADIKIIMASKDKCKALADYKVKMELHIQQLEAQYDCLNYLLNNDYDLEKTKNYIEHKLDQNIVIKDKLLQAFPGNYGVFLCVHFGRFLNEKIDSREKEVAYHRIIQFFDGLENLEFPKELEQFLVETFDRFKTTDIQKRDDELNAAVHNYNGFLDQNREAIERYLEYRNSDEFKGSSAYKMQQLLMNFQRNNGYYDVFISNLKILSNAYKVYQEKMNIANDKFLAEYPQARLNH